MVQNVGTVCSGNHNDLVVRIETVHLDQNRIECLLTFIMSAADESCSALPADGIDFIEENDTGRVFLGLLEQVTHTRCPDSDEHLHEIAPGNAEERHIRLPCYGLGKQRFSAAGWAYE